MKQAFLTKKIVLSGVLIATSVLFMTTVMNKKAGHSLANTSNTITIHAQAPLYTIPEAIFGNNMACYVPECNGSNTTVNQLMAASGQTVIRFPGGSYGDVYDWETYGTTDWRVSNNEGLTFVKSFGGTFQPIVNFSGYWNGVSHTRQEAVVKASSWVKELNINQKLKVKYWEVGNEIFGSWEKGYTTGTDYGSGFADFYKAMKAVDPTISIGAVAVVDDGSYGYWNRDMLQAAKAKGVVPDFLAIHAYPASTSATNAKIIDNGKNNIDGFTTKLNTQITKYLGSSYVGKIKYHMTEYNACLGDAAQNLTFTNALFCSQYVMEMAENKWGGANLWNIMNGNATNDAGDFGFISRITKKPFPNYYAYTLMIHKFGRNMIQNTGNTDNDIRVYSSKDSSGNVTVMLVNNSSLEEKNITLSFNGLNPSGNGKKWVLKSTGTDLENSRIVNLNGVDSPTPSSIKTNSGISISTKNNMSVNLAKYSITILKIPGSSTQASPVPTPTPVAPLNSKLLFDFETNTSGKDKWNVSTTTTMSTVVNPVNGGNCLQINVPKNTGTAAVNYYANTKQNLTECVDETTVSMKVYIAQECTNVSLQPYYKSKTGAWKGSWKQTPITKEFIEYSFVIPVGSGPITELGLQIINGPNSGGFVLIDDVKLTQKAPSYRLNIDPNQKYKIVNRKNGRSIGITDSSTANGAKLISSGGLNTWRFVEYYYGEYVILNATTGKAIDVPAASTANNVQLVQWNRSNSKNQRWIFLESTKGYVKLKNVGTGKIIDLSNLDAKSPVIQKTDENKTQQMWMLTKIN